MADQNIITTIFIIFTGASILSTLALFSRQTIIVSYIALGIIVGPNALSLVSDSYMVNEISKIGIIFLLFLLGLNLHPQSLIKTLQKTSIVTLTSSAIFAISGYLIALFFGFNNFESLIIGGCMMFSSTILGLKLLPTSVLHHQMMGVIIISILLLQDIIAITLILVSNILSQGQASNLTKAVLMFIAGLPGIILITYLLEKYVISILLRKFDTTKEYVFLLSIGWCLAITKLAYYFGLSHEIGAFIAGIALARTPIAYYIADNLKPLRDFFLVMFFFALGTQFNLAVLPSIIIPLATIVILMSVVKPKVFEYLLGLVKYDCGLRELANKEFNKEISIRLGQLSEFSLLFLFVVNDKFSLSPEILALIIAATIISFTVSSYWVVATYPSPLAIKDKLRLE